MKGCRRCGKPKPPGQGRKYCSPECAAAGPATGSKHCPDCDSDRLVPAEMREKAIYCKACLKARGRAQAKRHYQANRERVKAAVAAYREANVEQVNAAKRAHYHAHREEIRAKQAAYQREHREEQAERSRRWYAANREKHKATAERYRIAHREIVRERNRRWYIDLMADPERAQRRRELARMDARLRQERDGGRLRPLSPEAYLKRYGTGQFAQHSRIDASPLRQLLCECVADLTGFAESVPLSESAIHRIMLGHTERVAVRDADILCVALNMPVSLVYPDEYEGLTQIA
jgi:hypothetical protein